MPLRHKLLFTVLGVIFVVLAIMLVIAIRLGDDTPNDEGNNNLDSNSAGAIRWAPAHATPTALSPAPGAAVR